MILFLDTETSGIRPGNICQLSYIMQDKDGLSAKNFFFTVPFVEYGAYMVHGFSVGTLKTLSGGKVFADFIDEIDGDICRSDLLAAHNVAFDIMFLRSEFERCGVDFTYKENFCSMKKATPIVKLPRTHGAGYKYPRLSELCAFFGVTDDEIARETQKLFGESVNFHDARFDTTALFLSLKKSMDGFGDIFNLKGYL